MDRRSSLTLSRLSIADDLYCMIDSCCRVSIIEHRVLMLEHRSSITSDRLSNIDYRFGDRLSMIDNRSPLTDCSSIVNHRFSNFDWIKTYRLSTVDLPPSMIDDRLPTIGYLFTIICCRRRCSIMDSSIIGYRSSIIDYHRLSIAAYRS